MFTTLNSVALYPTIIQKIVKSSQGQRDLCDFTSEEFLLQVKLSSAFESGTDRVLGKRPLTYEASLGGRAGGS